MLELLKNGMKGFTGGGGSACRITPAETLEPQLT